MPPRPSGMTGSSRRRRAGSTPRAGPTARPSSGPTGSPPATRAATRTRATRSARARSDLHDDGGAGEEARTGDTIRGLRRSSSVVEQGTHKPLVGGSNPPSATSTREHAATRPAGGSLRILHPNSRRHPLAWLVRMPEWGQDGRHGAVEAPDAILPTRRRTVVARFTPEATR